MAMNKLLRVLKHFWLDETDSARALDETALQRLERRVADSERHHSGEIRLCIEASLPLAAVWRGASARERAIAMFAQLRVWDTEANNGVLVYLLLAEHAIEIVADRGLTQRVPQAEWDALVATMREGLRAGQFESALAAAVDTADTLLRQHFPLAEGTPNPDELPNRAHLS
jgi:uncharacterized membrane protein